MSPIADCKLDEYLKQDRKDVQRELLWTLFGCLASVLEFLHSIDIRHDDIKPSRVSLKEGKITLMGFEHALDWSNLEVNRESDPHSAFTRRYAAPEVISYEGRSSLSDVWSLGCIFLMIWTYLNGKSLEDMQSYLEKGTGNRLGYADNLERVNMWITHLQELSDNKVDKAPAEWIRNMLTPDQQARWSARTLLDAINQHGDRFIGECCRMRGNKQDTSETYDRAGPARVSQEWVGSDLDQEGEDNAAEGEPSDAKQKASVTYSPFQRHSGLSNTTSPPNYVSLYEIDPGVTDVTPSSSTVQQQLERTYPTISNTEKPTSGRSSVRRWLDRAGAYIKGTGQKELDTQRHGDKKAPRFPEIPGEEARNPRLTEEQYWNLRRQRVHSPASSIRSSERPDGEGLSTPMPHPSQDYLEQPAKRRDIDERNRDYLVRMEKERYERERGGVRGFPERKIDEREAEWQAELRDELGKRNERDRQSDLRPRDGG